MSAAAYVQVAPGGAPGERPPTPLTLFRQREPFSTLFVLLVVGYTLLLKVPVCAVFYTVPSTRPIETWSWTEAMVLSCIRELLLAATSRKPLNRIDLSGDQESTFKATVVGTPVWIPKLEKPLTGELGKMMEQTGDRSVRVSAWWYGGTGHNQPPDGRGKKCILYFHGRVES